MGSLLALAYTLFVAHYTALGFELTPDYDERTRVVRGRMCIGLCGSLAVGWFFRLAVDKYWPSLWAGAFWVTVRVAAIVLVSGMIPVFGCKEEPVIEEEEPIKFLEAVRYTLTKRPFVIFFIPYVTMIVALFSEQSIAPLLMQHYVYGGDAIRLGNLQGGLMTMGMMLSYASILLVGWISMRPAAAPPWWRGAWPTLSSAPNSASSPWTRGGRGCFSSRRSFPTSGFRAAG